MNPIWLKIESAPAVQFYRDRRAIEHMDGGLHKHGLLIDIPPLLDSVQGENLNVTLTLENGAGQCSLIFLRPPIGETVTIYNGADVVLTGVVTGCALDSQTCAIEVEA